MWYNIQGGEGDNFGKRLASTRVRGYIRNFILALSFRTSARPSAQVTLVFILSFRTGAERACIAYPPLPRYSGVSSIRTLFYYPSPSKKCQKASKNPIFVPLASLSPHFRVKKETPRKLLTQGLKKFLTWLYPLCYNGRGDSLCRVNLCRIAKENPWHFWFRSV